MNKIIINKANIVNYDSCMMKTRALVFDENGKIYLCNMNNSYVLPGGTIEDGETSLQTLIRELNEELGLSNISDIQELINIDFHHKDFPKYKQDGFENRLNSVFYYIVNINSCDIGNGNFTEYEKENNDRVECCFPEEIKSLINRDTSNKWKVFTDLELTSVLDYYLEKDKKRTHK